ncbi:hypothetical protein [Siphonobacter sp. SORGH_AS_0500]|uniref:hypothetical protein n=1 Tax=Siphonobacter sp. SORGH_AS_0500 TaxID=1864824 RepID=UPI0012FED209|nr:hypothetical protein [Siphonobacter sp. SORGH_AS_0500]
MKTTPLTLKQLAQLKVKENPELDEQFRGKVLFPEKLALAHEEIRKYGLSFHSKRK